MGKLHDKYRINLSLHQSYLWKDESLFYRMDYCARLFQAASGNYELFDLANLRKLCEVHTVKH